jgi:hypothetical protein
MTFEQEVRHQFLTEIAPKATAEQLEKVAKENRLLADLAKEEIKKRKEAEKKAKAEEGKKDAK